MNDVLWCGERPDPARHQEAGPGHGGHQHRERHLPGGSQVRMSLYIYYSTTHPNEELDQSQPSMNGPAQSFPSNSPHTGPRVEQGTDNNNSNSIPFSLSVKTNGDSDLDETLIQYS